MRNDNNLTSNMHLLSVAPMMDWTDRHERAFLRVISKRTLLYTAIVTTGAILHGDRDRLLAFDASAHPVALQLGGPAPEDLPACASRSEEPRVGKEGGRTCKS